MWPGPMVLLTSSPISSCYLLDHARHMTLGPLYLIFPLHLVNPGPPFKLTANITSLLKPTMTALGSHSTL